MGVVIQYYGATTPAVESHQHNVTTRLKLTQYLYPTYLGSGYDSLPYDIKSAVQTDSTALPVTGPDIFDTGGCNTTHIVGSSFTAR